MNPSRFKSGLIVGVGALCLIATILALRLDPGSDRRIRHLADGSTLELREAVLATNHYSYQHHGGNRVQRMLAPLAPILPDFLETRILSSSRGGISIAGDFTNLVAVTVSRESAPAPDSNGSSPDPARLVVFDEAGNEFDACWGAGTLGMQGESARVWNINAFPRRHPTFGLRFLGTDSSNHWTEIAEFIVRNPAHAPHPQWSAEPWPATRSDGDLDVTLSEFESGAPFRTPISGQEERTVPRKTRLRFDFSKNGRPAENWRVQKLKVSDATGNAWSPFLDLVKQDFDWATNGTVEFHGALWPGEAAWKLDVELVRTSGFQSDELFESPPLTIPSSGVDTNLNVGFQRGELTVTLAGLASPQADHPDPFKWIAKYWGDEDKDKVISLAIQVTPTLSSNRLSFVRAIDQNGNEAALVAHNGQDSAEQALLLKPSAEARQLRFTFAVQRSRFAHFLARPAFVDRPKAR